MQNAARYARHLGLMPDVIDDKRSDPVTVYTEEREEYFDGSREPGVESGFDEAAWEMPSISISDSPAFAFPTATVEGYDYHPSDQPLHVEVWVEKTTAKPQLEGVCAEHHANLQWGMGAFGIEVCRDLVDRVKKWEKPCRVLYLCDYDPAGIWMPISVGRQVEFILHEDDEDDELELRVEVLAVTTGQIVGLDLPRKPFEEKEHKWARTRDENFEKHLGEGGTELNAIDDYELAEIVEQRILAYRDEGLRAAVADAKAGAEEALKGAMDAAEADFSAEIAALDAEVEAVRARYAAIVERLNARMRRELELASRQRANLRERIQTKLDELDVELPDYPEGEVEEPFDEEHYLYDSSRTYLEQMRHYRRRQGREDEWDAVLEGLLVE